MIISSLKSQMIEGIKALEHRFAGLRTGRANPALLEPIMVDAYGGRMPLSQLGNITASEARWLMVHVWDASVTNAVDKAIRAFGLTPVVEGTVLRIPLPELSQERRQELVKMAKTYGEEARIGLRNLRRSALDNVSKEDFSEDKLHELKKNIQKVTDDYIQEVDALLIKKEKEIIKV